VAPRTTASSVSRWLTPTVLAISLASLLSDACYEMVIPLLPVLVTALGGGAFVLGVIEGVSDLISAAFKLASGPVADTSTHRKAYAASGYLGVGIFMPLIALAHSIMALGALRSAAWIFRGFRGPIRDTLLVEGTDPAFVNRAFGFQRALDSAGAALGPAMGMVLVAFHANVRTVIALSAIPGLWAGLMYLWVVEKPRAARTARSMRSMFADLPGPFRRFLVASGLFGFGNFSATLLVLIAMRALLHDHDARVAVTLATAFYLAHNVILSVLTYPAGVLSERFGSGRMLCAAFAFFGVAYVVLAFFSTSVVAVAAVFAAAAIGIAIVDPNEGTFATKLLATARRGSGYGALAAVNGVGDFVSSAGIGALWQWAGPLPAFGAAAVLCFAGAAVQATLPPTAAE